LQRDDPKRGGVAHLGDVLANYLRDTRLDRRLREEQVFAAWNGALGAALAERARAVRFSEGELVVEVSSAALLGELVNFTGNGYRRAANARLGSERIHSVSFKPQR
jgi:hypothetical protein